MIFERSGECQRFKFQTHNRQTETSVDMYIRTYILARVYNISREGECLTAYTCFKCTALSTESTPSGVN